MELKDKLRELRQNRGMTARELGDVFGLNPSTISGYEGGFRTPDIEVLKKYADYFGVSIDSLVNREEASALSLERIASLIKDDRVNLRGQELSEFEKMHLLTIIEGLLRNHPKP